MVRLTKKKNNTNTNANAKERFLRLLSVLGRYSKRKISSIYKKLVKKEPRKTAKVPNILENQVNSAEKLQKKVNKWIKGDC